MTWETIEIAGKIFRIAAADSPVCVLIQPTGEHEQAHLTEEAGQILQHASCEALFVSFPIADWDQELSPWHARQAFGEESFGSGAGATLQWILEKLLPALRSQLHLPENIPYILGGYSLAGLFSLWAAYTRPMSLRQWQLVPPQFGWTAGQNMPHCIVLRHRTSTLVLEPKNTKPETRCCER